MTEPKGLLSSDNPYSCRHEIDKWLAWDTAWHKLALEVASRKRTVKDATPKEFWTEGLR